MSKDWGLPKTAMNMEISNYTRKSLQPQKGSKGATRKVTAPTKSMIGKKQRSKEPENHYKEVSKDVDWDDQTWVSSHPQNSNTTSIEDQVMQFRDLDNQQILEQRQPTTSADDQKDRDLYYYDDESAFTVLVKDTDYQNQTPSQHHHERDQNNDDEGKVIHHLRTLKRATHQKRQATKIRITNVPSESSSRSKSTVRHHDNTIGTTKSMGDVSVYSVASTTGYRWGETIGGVRMPHDDDDFDESFAATTVYKSPKTVVGATFFHQSMSEFVCGSLDLVLEGEEPNYKEDVDGLFWENE